MSRLSRSLLLLLIGIVSSLGLAGCGGFQNDPAGYV